MLYISVDLQAADLGLQEYAAAAQGCEEYAKFGQLETGFEQSFA